MRKKKYSHKEVLRIIRQLISFFRSFYMKPFGLDET